MFNSLVVVLSFLGGKRADSYWLSAIRKINGEIRGFRISNSITITNSKVSSGLSR
jgi:hypothetical protein